MPTSTQSAKKSYASGDKKTASESSLTPLDFMAFVPWAALQYELEYFVRMTMVVQEDYPPQKSRSKSRKGSSVSMKTRTLLTPRLSLVNPTTAGSSEDTLPSEHDGPLIYIRAVYDKRGQLLSVSLEQSVPLPRKLINILNICAHFHPMFTKLTLRKGLSMNLLSDVGNFLSHSHLTDICLDGSCISGGGYYVLLDKPSHLKCLYLSRCSIDDVECEEIAARLGYETHHSKTLSVLDVSCNLITDRGARALGQILRTNRQLAYLNLSGNKLTDQGASHLLDLLKQFPLTVEEIDELKLKRTEYFAKKMKIYFDVLADLKAKQDMTVINRTSRLDRTQDDKRKNLEEYPPENLEDLANTQAVEAVGLFSHPLYTSDVLSDREFRYKYCSGNFRLCYLNLAYNNLGFLSVIKLKRVLRYQANCKKVSSTGLLRVVLTGNAIPEECNEMMWTGLMFSENISLYVPPRKSKILSRQMSKEKNKVTRY